MLNKKIRKNQLHSDDPTFEGQLHRDRGLARHRILRTISKYQCPMAGIGLFLLKSTLLAMLCYFTLHYFTLYYVTLRYVTLWYIKLLFTLCTLRYLHYVFANFDQLFNVSIATLRFFAFIASTAPNIM